MVFDSGLGGTAFAFVGTICAWFVTAKVGRRTVYIFGECMSCILLVIIGSIAAGANEGPGLWAQAAIALLWIVSTPHQITVLLAESSSSSPTPSRLVQSRTASLLRSVPFVFVLRRSFWLGTPIR